MCFLFCLIVFECLFGGILYVMNLGYVWVAGSLDVWWCILFSEFQFGVMNLLEYELYSFVFRNEKAYSSKKKKMLIREW
jgi:hypothetical protein